MVCPSCKQESKFRHMHNAAHGIESTHMAGSERYECENCKKCFYKSEGEKYGFKYILD